MAAKKPLVGVVCDRKLIGPHSFHIVGDKYLKALMLAADVTPVMIPAMGLNSDVATWMEHLDGIFLPGAYSMLDPEHYGETSASETFDKDSERDATSLALIKRAIAEGMPILGVCRGFQEMVVATGGTLNQLLHEDDRYQDHREDKTQTLDEQYDKAHSVSFTKGGLLAQIAGCNEAMVNSLHVQGAGTIGSAAKVEAVSPDGLVEAISVIDSSNFAMAVQWHPEWKVLEDDVSKRLFARFGTACKQHQLR